MSRLDDEQPFAVVRLWDEAIDWKRSAANEEEYALRRDLSKLVFRDGMRPAVFWVKRLRDEIAVRLADLPGDYERWRQAFIFALAKVENGEDRYGEPVGVGGVLVPEHLRAERKKGGNAFLTDAERELFSLEVQVEIGAVAYQRSFFDRRTAPAFELPRTSARAWVGLSSRRAELDALAAGETGNAPPPQPKSTADGSASGGDVTVTETPGMA